MTKIRETFARLARDERGPTPVEWAVIAAVLITAVAVSFPLLNNLLRNFFQGRVGDALNM